MGEKLNGEVFRAYDIRGIYPRDIDERFARLAGRALASHLGGGRLAVSMDVRMSNEKLTKPFAEGLVESGVEVWYIGIAPSPLLYFAIAHYGLDGGAAVSASHNPPEWNGFKMCGRGARALDWGKGLEKIKEIMERGEFAAGAGSIVDKQAQVRGDYERFVNDRIRFSRRLRIGVDPGNGASSGFASSMLSRMPLEVHAINDRPDGRFPSRAPEPKPGTLGQLVELVKSEGLDMGVAFDGDGDRAIFVDDRGEIMGGDRCLALLAKGMLKKGDKVVYEVSCSDAVTDVVEEMGGVPIVTKVGHSVIEGRMLEEDARLGGEISGHIYFRETYHFDDAFFATACMAKLVSDSGRKLSELSAELPRYSNSGMREFEVADKEKFKIVAQVRKSLESRGVKTINLDGVKAVTEDGWFIIRASNTSPRIKMVAEARTGKRAGELAAIAKREIEDAMRSAHL